MGFDYEFDPNRETLREYADRLVQHQGELVRDQEIFQIAADGYTAQGKAAADKARKILTWEKLLLIPAALFWLLTALDGVGWMYWLFLSLLFSMSSIALSFWQRKALRVSNEAWRNLRDLKLRS